MKEYDLLVCIRCHTRPSLILDTVSAVRQYTDRSTTRVVCAVDGRKKVARRLRRSLGKDSVYCSDTKWGWGAGLYGLLAESILWSKERWNYSHFLSIDYDTLFIGPGAESDLLSRVQSQGIGLVGVYNHRNEHWKNVFDCDRIKIQTAFGRIPPTYHPGEGVQGGCMLLTHSFLRELSSRGMLKPPYSTARNYTTMADDHLVALFCRMCKLTIVEAPLSIRSRWRLYGRHPVRLSKSGVKVFHPVKPTTNGDDLAAEVAVRNYYRKLRGKPLLRKRHVLEEE